MTMLGHNRRIDDTERSIVRGVFFGADDLYVIGRALSGHGAALGDDEKDRARVGKHLNRLANMGEPYFEADLRELQAVLHDLVELWTPQRFPKWWRERGAPGSDDAVEGLAAERARQIDQATRALEVVAACRELVGG